MGPDINEIVTQGSTGIPLRYNTQMKRYFRIRKLSSFELLNIQFVEAMLTQQTGT
jgi:hypothetical protein